MEEATINMEVGVKAEVEAGVVTYINSETGEQVLMTGENGEQVLMTGEHGEQILMTGENGEQILMTGENGQQVLMTGENGEQVLMTTGEVLESFSEGGEESVLGYQEAEDTGQPGQDLVSLAMETSKVTGLAAAEETKEEVPPQDQEAADTEDYPDEIECQLVQKSVFLDGEVKTIDFIMCNQCPRLFRSENLLWNHIKAKHKRRTYRRLPLTSHALDRNYSSVAGGGVKPDLLKLLADLFSEDREQEVTTLWEMVAALAQVGKDRSSGEIIASAKKYLEKSYVKFIR